MNNILITGANKGIGFETAKQLAQKGNYIYLGSRDKAKGTEAVRQLKDQGISNVALLVIDITEIDVERDSADERTVRLAALLVLEVLAGVRRRIQWP